ncbi:periplasmic binding protein [Xylanimonas cellulosilytica DSM 15894]|uniref:Periplasmic binding protein n=1 Tax=Xylanimonas cellulosilytica (strain DSM 15894 / JCM 12276 / CECT 5975 / KCTC 9989 / LMG 20990 / NBRC 107835 / XIL07) TaxID=446471 RepID=D1BRZ0_XYLCX|nr:Fe2+-enterobactin ABC transporter substrate-binding protein [Xylanimonas cellulosilytica]ACZ30482.1 periplasmic binding protein [Xylanimonas cellulosilytica DSM 15894]
MVRTVRRSLTAAAAVAALLTLAACSGDAAATDDATPQPGASAEADAETGTWPRTVEHESGTAEIPEQPLRIVSTSLTLTGTLLAIDAPVIASAATSPSPMTDDQGFFSQWADVAAERGVEVLYPNLELDLEAVELAEPDLIIGSTIGADATVEAYDQLSEIAPTIMLDYGSHSWQELAAVLGEATGLEESAAAVVADFDASLAEAATQITLPAQPTSLLVYNGADGVNIFSATSSQAQVLTGLGFEYREGPAELAATTRSDVATFTPENSAAALRDSGTALLVPLGGSSVDAFSADPLLANLPAITGDSVVEVPPTAFRMDFFSATELVDFLVATFGA